MKEIVLSVICFALLNVSHSQVHGDILGSDVAVNDKSVQDFYKWITKSEYASYHENLLKEKEKHKWNDWIYYKIVEETANIHFPYKGDRFKTLFCWYILNRSELDVRLMYFNNTFLLFAFTEEQVSGISKFYKDKKKFVCISSTELIGGRQAFESKLVLNDNNRSFQFAINDEINLPIETVPFEQGFYDSLIHNEFIVLNICVNEILIRMLETYPNIEFNKLFNTPLSPEAYNCLIPKFKELLKDVDTVTMAKFIFHFVRDGFDYRDDRDQTSWGREKWLTPEEALTITLTGMDCEDKSALFYCLIKELLNIPIIVLNYPGNEHVNVGLSLDDHGEEGDFIFNGRTYLVCDPTNYPNLFGKDKKYEEWKYEIVIDYSPDENRESRN